MITVTDAIVTSPVRTVVSTTGLYDVLYRELTNCNGGIEKNLDPSIDTIQYLESYRYGNNKPLLCDIEMVFPLFLKQCDEDFEQIMMSPVKMCDNTQQYAILHIMGEKAAKHKVGNMYQRKCVGSTCHGVINTNDIFIDTEVRVIYEHFKIKQTPRQIANKIHTCQIYVHGVYLWTNGKVRKVEKACTSIMVDVHTPTDQMINNTNALEYISEHVKKFFQA